MDLYVEYRQKNIVDKYSFPNHDFLSFCDNGCKTCKNCILYDELQNYIICNSTEIIPRTMTKYDDPIKYSKSLYWDHNIKQFLCNLKK
jgi:hypothetical protein